MKKLTIAIPTYNGARTVQRTLESIFNQPFSINEVDVIVCNNCSTDGTLGIIKPFESRLKLFNNETNLGGDRNFQLCVERSASEYVWIVGDDDFLREDAIEKVLQKIRDRQYAAIFVNFSLYDVKSQMEVLPRYVAIERDIIAKGISSFLEHTTIAANFLSAVIHNKKCFESVDATNYYGSCWLQFAVILDYVNDQETLIIAEPYVANMGDSSDREFNRGGVAVKILSNLFTIVKNAKSPFIQQSVRNKTLDIIHQRLKYRILSAKRLGLKVTPTLFKELQYNFGSYRSFWPVDAVLLYTPNFIIDGIYFIYRLKPVNTFLTRYLFK